MKSVCLSFWVGVFALITVSGRAEWRTESFALKPGWNAIYPLVDATHTTMDAMFALRPEILEVWRWQPERVDPRLPGDATTAPVGIEWATWKNGVPEDTSFNQLTANYGYLVRVADTSPAFTLDIKGRVALPEIRWRGDGLHLAGFPTIVSGTKPTFSSYLAPAGFSLAQSQILRYNGGDILANVNPIVTNPSVGRIDRGAAYWIRVNKFSRYYGPLNVELGTGSKLDFGERSDTLRLVLTNQTTGSLTFTLGSVASDSAPAGQKPVVGAVPVQLRIDAESDFTPLTGIRTLTLAAGAVMAVNVIVDRPLMTGATGAHYASHLKITTTAGVAGQEVFVPVTADVGSMAGLWIGEALIKRVASVRKRYERDANGNTVIDQNPLNSDGSANLNYLKPRLLEDFTTPGASDELPQTSRVYSLRLIAHVKADGTLTLLQHVYQGVFATDTHDGPVVLTTRESLLDQTLLKSAVRLSVAHLPLDAIIPLGGPFLNGSTLTQATPLVTAFDAADNPFVHLYHPDHDNRDSRFQPTLSSGRESFDLKRTITLKLDSAAPTGATSGWGTTLMTGTYNEFVEGPYKHPIRSQGAFALHKVSDISTLTTTP